MNATNQIICHGLKYIHFEKTSAVVVTVIGTCLINAVCGVFAQISNALIMVAISWKASLRTPSNLLLFCMCITDFLVGFVVQMLYVVLRLHEIFDVHLCIGKKIFAFFGYLCSGASFMTLTVVTLDRWFAIAHPYRYQSIELFNKYVVVMVIVWLLWFIFCALPFAGVIMPGIFFASLAVVMVLSVATVVFCYVKIHMVVRKHEQQIDVQIVHIDRDIDRDAASSESSRVRTIERRRSNTVAIIVLVFLGCYLPKICAILVNILVGDTLQVLFVVGKWSETLCFLNSSLNPFIYCLRIESIRNEVKHILGLIKGKVSPFNPNP